MTDTPDMVERVARAIYASDGEENGPWNIGTEHARKCYRENARAAIEAMREPTHAMVDEAVRVAQSGGMSIFYGLVKQGPDAFKALWQHQIDAALK